MKVPCAEVIGHHEDPNTIEKRMREMCSVLWVDLRNPDRNTHILKSDYEVTNWHRDGDVHDGEAPPYAIVIWSNRELSEVLDMETKEILRFPPGSIVLIRNRRAKHRIPPEISPDRWFCRAYDVKIRKLKRDV